MLNRTSFVVSVVINGRDAFRSSPFLFLFFFIIIIIGHKNLLTPRFTKIK